MIASPDFFSFKILVVWVINGVVGGAKNEKWSKLTKNSVSLHISETVPHVIMVFGTHVK